MFIAPGPGARTGQRAQPRRCLAFGVATLLAMAFTEAQATLITYVFGDEATGTLVGSGDDTYFTGTSEGRSINVFGYKSVDLNDLGDLVASSFDDTEEVVVDTDGGNRGLSVDSEDGDDGDRLDGEGPDEALRFQLDGGGTLLAIAFDNFGEDDDFSLVVDGTVALVDLGDLEDDIWRGSFEFADDFAIGADGASDVFRVRSITVSVFEASTFWMLSSLLLVALTSRLRRASLALH